MYLQMNKHSAGYFLKDCFEAGQCTFVVFILFVLRDKNFPYNFKFFGLAHIALNTGTRNDFHFLVSPADANHNTIPF